MARGHHDSHGGRGTDDMDVEGQNSQQRNPEAQTEEEIEAEAEAEMHELRHMLDQVGRRDFLEGLFTLLKALNSLIGYMKAMNRHVGKIDEDISKHTVLLQSLDDKISTLLEKKTVEMKASPKVFQGSCSQHTSAAVYQADTPNEAFVPKQVVSKMVGKDAHTLDEVKKRLDMCVDLTISDDDEPKLKEPLSKGLHIDLGAAKCGAKSGKKTPTKMRKKATATRGKDLLKGLEVEFDVSESDNDDCIIVQSPTQSTRRISEDKEKNKGKNLASGETPTSRPRKMARSNIFPDYKKSSKKIGHILPKGMDSKFRPTPEMSLTEPEIRLCAYLFQLHGDPREELIKIGSAIGTRQQLHTLCPNHVIDNKIIELMAAKLTWNQHNMEVLPAWILPPQFAEAVLKGKMAEDLLPEFAKNWMSAFDLLKYIYVPVMESNGDWFLMVASMEDTVIYLVDSFLNSQQTSSRKKSVRAIGKVIGRMMCSSYYPQNYLEGNYELGNWDIEEARASDEDTNSTQHSAICTLEWMQMDDVFMSNLLPRVEDKMVRMKAAMKLMNGPHNEFLDLVIGKAEEFWANQMCSD